MRRSDREIKDFDEIIKVIEKCDVCRLGFNDGEYPYIIPLNFGMQIESGKIVLYFHGATEGKKYDLIAKNNKASFEMDCSHRLVMDDEKGNCTMEYESVMGHGTVEVLQQEEKENGLYLLMKHYHQENFEFNKEIIPVTTVFKMTVEEYTGKKLMKKIVNKGKNN